jgi:sugar fermentation stimulation protein A
MNYEDPLIRGRLIGRYKRFLSDVELDDGEVVTAHCANPGSMLNLQQKGAEVWLSPARNFNRKLKYTWELIRVNSILVGVNTSLPNKIVEDAIRKDLVPELLGYDSLRREVKYGKNSRIDILLEGGKKPACYVEIKSVTLSRPEIGKKYLAEFPDSKTVRGTKHLYELMDQITDGKRSVLFFLVQREDCDQFTVANDIDPVYSTAIDKAKIAGVEILCYGCSISTRAITIRKRLEIII